MSYAETADVQARAGRFAQAWTDTSTPSFDDVERLLRTRAAEIDAGLQGRGIATPVTGTAGEALRSLNAAGALILLLTASALGQAAEAVSALLDRVQKEWDEGMQAIREGTHPAVSAVEATSTEDSTANDFWTEESGYGLEGWTDPDSNPYLAPLFERTEIL